jgi:hypothetical protein
MRQITTVIVFATLFFVSSCSKDKDPDPPATMAAKIQHKWIFESVYVYGNSNLTGASFFGMAGNGTDYFTFNPNGKLYTLMIGSYDSAKLSIRSGFHHVYEHLLWRHCVKRYRYNIDPHS